MSTFILIKDYVLDGKMLKKGALLDLDRERERELKICGAIDNDNIIVEQAVLITTNKETRTKVNNNKISRRTKK